MLGACREGITWSREFPVDRAAIGSVVIVGIFRGHERARARHFADMVQASCGIVHDHRRSFGYFGGETENHSCVGSNNLARSIGKLSPIQSFDVILAKCGDIGAV